MFKTDEQKLKEASILDENEPILCLIPVVDYLKQQQQFKKITKEEIASLLPASKQFYFLASIKTTDNDSTPILYLLKQNEKTNDYKLKVTYYLNDLKSITKLDDKFKQTTTSGQQLVSDVFAFELVFRSDADDAGGKNQDDSKYKFVWQCNNADERNKFLDTLWKLSEQFLKKADRPKFLNYTFEKKKPDVNSQEREKNAKNNSDGNKKDGAQGKTSDEDSLLKLMSECNFASLSAERFIERLQNELLDLDTSNIESIMNSEENTLKLIEMLDGAMDEIEKIDTRLKDYEDKISAVGEAVRIVGEHDDVIQLQQKNQHDLFDMLENMISSLEFPQEYKVLMSECDFSSPQRLARVVVAANALLDVLETDLPNGLKKMKSYEEQKKFLEHLKLRFCNNCSTHLRNAIAHATNKHLESYKIVDNSLNSLPLHKQIFDDLLIYRDLMPWMYRSGCSFNDQSQTKTYFNDIRQNYIETVKQLYLRELVPFCTCARAKIAKNDRPKTTTSMDNLKGGKGLDKAYAMGGDFFSVKIDVQTKDMLKLVFIKLLNQITSVVQAEQAFCQDFFSTRSPTSHNRHHNEENNSSDKVSRQNSSLSNGHAGTTGNNLTRYPSDASLTSSSTSNSKQTQLDSKMELLALSEIFMNTVEEQVKQVMESIFRTETMMVIFLYSDLLSRVLVSHNHKQYMHQPLVGLLRYAKERCDEYCNFFKDAIREHKVNKREKIGILRYVLYFEEFVKEAESCWEPIKKDMYEKLCIIYQSIVNEIFKGIESVSVDSQKTPPDVVRFQNYHHMTHIMRSINGLKDSTKYAREQYMFWKQSYIKEFFGRPLVKIAAFFEKVDQKIERGCKHEDISYQLELSANNLREIIREYPAREVKKGLDNLYNGVKKHLVENSSLLEVVWRDMSNEFIKQYKNYEKLIAQCYPGQRITFEFTDQDICQFFEEIAQTH